MTKQEYFQIYRSHAMAGYTGIHQEADALPNKKGRQEFRGCHLATEAFQFLVNLCRERGLSKIYLTCNKHNDNTPGHL